MSYNPEGEYIMLKAKKDENSFQSSYILKEEDDTNSKVNEDLFHGNISMISSTMEDLPSFFYLRFNSNQINEFIQGSVDYFKISYKLTDKSNESKIIYEIYCEIKNLTRFYHNPFDFHGKIEKRRKYKPTNNNNNVCNSSSQEDKNNSFSLFETNNNNLNQSSYINKSYNPTSNFNSYNENINNSWAYSEENRDIQNGTFYLSIRGELTKNPINDIFYKLEGVFIRDQNDPNIFSYLKENKSVYGELVIPKNFGNKLNNMIYFIICVQLNYNKFSGSGNINIGGLQGGLIMLSGTKFQNNQIELDLWFIPEHIPIKGKLKGVFRMVVQKLGGSQRLDYYFYNTNNTQNNQKLSNSSQSNTNNSNNSNNINNSSKSDSYNNTKSNNNSKIDDNKKFIDTDNSLTKPKNQNSTNQNNQNNTCNVSTNSNTINTGTNVPTKPISKLYNSQEVKSLSNNENLINPTQTNLTSLSQTLPPEPHSDLPKSSCINSNEKSSVVSSSDANKKAEAFIFLAKKHQDFCSEEYILQDANQKFEYMKCNLKISGKYRLIGDQEKQVLLDSLVLKISVLTCENKIVGEGEIINYKNTNNIKSIINFSGTKYKDNETISTIECKVTICKSQITLYGTLTGKLKESTINNLKKFNEENVRFDFGFNRSSIFPNVNSSAVNLIGNSTISENESKDLTRMEVSYFLNDNEEMEFINNVCRSKKGMTNMGNTCYINSNLQILIHSEVFIKMFYNEFKPYLIKLKSGSANNEVANKQSNDFRLSLEFYNLLISIYKYKKESPHRYNNNNLNKFPSLVNLLPFYSMFYSNNNINLESIYSNEEFIYPNSFVLLYQKVFKKYKMFEENDSQEFCRDFLEQINTELNRNKNKPVYKPVLDMDNKSKYKKSETLEEFLKASNREYSFISEIFSGVIIYEQKYSKCINGNPHKALDYNYSQFKDILLNFKDPNKSYTLQELIDECFLMEEIIETTEVCKICGKKINMERRQKIAKFPKILVFSLQRIYWPNNSKVLSSVNVREFIDLEAIGDKELLGGNKVKYELFAINNHCGEQLNTGHFYSYIKIDKKWYAFNDIIVREFNPNLNSNDSYNLYYKLLE